MVGHRWIAREAVYVDHNHTGTPIRGGDRRRKTKAMATKMVDTMDLCHPDAMDSGRRQGA